jgi:hypothetical protein
MDEPKATRHQSGFPERRQESAKTGAVTGRSELEARKVVEFPWDLAAKMGEESALVGLEGGRCGWGWEHATAIWKMAVRPWAVDRTSMSSVLGYMVTSGLQHGREVELR